MSDFTENVTIHRTAVAARLKIFRKLISRHAHDSIEKYHDSVINRTFLSFGLIKTQFNEICLALQEQKAGRTD